MKRLVLILLILFGYSAYSQFKTISLETENLKGKVASYTNKTFLATRNSEDLQLKYNQKCTFNTKGNIERIENFKENQKLDTKEVFDYKNGLLSKHTIYNSIGTIGKSSQFEYDQKGNLTSEKKFNRQGKLQYDTSYLYNKKGQLTAQQKLIPSINYTMKENYKYDDFNNLIVRTKTARIGTTKETFRYNSKGLPIKKSEFNAMGELFSVIKYEYNEQNDKISLKKYDVDNQMNYDENYEYVYDSNGNWTLKISYEKGVKTHVEKRLINYN